MNFAFGFITGSLVFLVARRASDRRLILALSQRCYAQSQLLSRKAERRATS